MDNFNHDQHSIGTSGYRASAIAIIGVACAFPGVPDFARLWDVLAEGRETITHFTHAELEAAGVRADRLNAPNYVKSKGVLEGVEYFDHELFNIDPDRALIMDPQHRVFIQKCWEALDDAGYDPRRYKRPIGLFAGSAINTYVLNNLRHANRSLSRKFSSIEFLLTTDKDFLTTQTSYLLGLTGPSVTVQTACSTSLSAVHFACESVLSGESEMALAGAVTVYAPQVKGYFYEPDSIVSPDGHVRSFDARGGGTVYSSGVGVVLLKRLQDALTDHDHIYAVIRSTAVNNDGGRKASFKMPSADGIADVARTALDLAEIPAKSIGMMEANGSGTAFGDPIEVEALTRVYTGESLPVGSIPMGSIKSNIGHMNVTAGMGALLKTVLSLQHGKVPPCVNFEKPNPRIAFESSPFYVCTRLTDWPVQGYPRRAAVNIYGVGGTNTHAILEEAPEATQIPSGRSLHLLALSSAAPDGLENQRQTLCSYLAAHPHLDLGDVAFTLNQGHQQLRHRCAAVVSGHSTADLKTAMNFPIRGQAPEHKLKTCLVVAGTEGRDLQPVLAAQRACGEFARELSSVVEEIPELAAFIDAHLYGSVAAFDPYKQQCLTLATDIALSRMLLNTGLQIDAVYGGGHILAVLAAARVLSLESVVQLHRTLFSSPPSAKAQFLQAATAEIAVGLPALPLYSPLDGSFYHRKRPVDRDSLCKLLLQEENITTSLRHAQSEHGYLMAVLGQSDAADGLTVHRITPISAACTVGCSILSNVGALWTQGVEFDLRQYYKMGTRNRVSLPAYSFAKCRHWVDIPVEAKASNYDVAL
jgi:acyl transferase domain-containing protein